MTPFVVGADDPDLPAILTLIQTAFAPMQGRVSPPSSIDKLSIKHLRHRAACGALWVIGRPPAAAVIATVQSDALYLGKLAVAPACRGQGLARLLIDQMAQQARALRLPRLRVETRVELVENHATFAALGFVETGRSAHPGFNRPTSLTLERAV